jgi:hypothetical protein
MVALNLKRLTIWICYRITLKLERKAAKTKYSQRLFIHHRNKRMSGVQVREYKCQGLLRDSTLKTLNWNFQSLENKKVQ